METTKVRSVCPHRDRDLHRFQALHVCRLFLPNTLHVENPQLKYGV